MSLRTTLTIDFGNEYGPDTPFGADRLTLQPDGRFVFEVRKKGRALRSKTGTVDETILMEIERDLEDARFPAVPTHPMPPGGGYVAITTSGEEGDRRASMLLSTAESFPGYGPLLKRAAEWTRCLRDDRSATPPGLRLD